MAKIIDKPALQAVHLGNPKDVLKMDGESPSMFMGVVYGVAKKTRPKITMDKAGNELTFEQIVGDFEGIPADKKEADMFRSQVLYLPENIHADLAKILNLPDAEPIKFAVELYAIKNGKKGIKWEAKSLIPVSVVDALAEIREAIAGKTKAIPAKHESVTPPPKKK